MGEWRFNRQGFITGSALGVAPVFTTRPQIVGNGRGGSAQTLRTGTSNGDTQVTRLLRGETVLIGSVADGQTYAPPSEATAYVLTLETIATSTATGLSSFDLAVMIVVPVAPSATAGAVPVSLFSSEAMTAIDVAAYFSGPFIAFEISPNSDPLPPGLTLSAAGVLSGTPADPLSSSATIIVRGVNDGGFAEKTLSPFSVTLRPPGDTTAPTLTFASPAAGTSNVPLNTSVSLGFSEPVVPGSGLLTLRSYDGAAWSNVETFDVVTEIGSGPGQIEFTNNFVTLHPTSPFIAGRLYALRLAATAVRDAAGNAFAGIATDTALSFTATTGAVAPADYVVTSDAEWAAVFALPDATLSGKIVEIQGSNFTKRSLSNRTFSPPLTIRSADVNASIPAFEHGPISGLIWKVNFQMTVDSRGVADHPALWTVLPGTSNDIEISDQQKARQGYGPGRIDFQTDAQLPEYERRDHVVTAGIVSQAVALTWQATGLGGWVEFFNRGTSAVHVAFGDTPGVIATTADTQVAAGAYRRFSVGERAYGAVIAVSGSPVVNFRTEVGLDAYLCDYFTSAGNGRINNFRMLRNNISDLADAIKPAFCGSGDHVFMDNVVRRTYQDIVSIPWQVDPSSRLFVLRNTYELPFARSGVPEASNGDARDPHGDEEQHFDSRTGVTATAKNIFSAGNRALPTRLRPGTLTQGDFWSDNAVGYEDCYSVANLRLGGNGNGMTTDNCGDHIFVYGATIIAWEGPAASSPQLKIKPRTNAHSYVGRSIASVIRNNGTGVMEPRNSLQVAASTDPASIFADWPARLTATNRAEIDAALTTIGAAAGLGAVAVGAACIDWTTQDYLSVIRWDQLPAGVVWAEAVNLVPNTLYTAPLRKVLAGPAVMPVTPQAGTEYRVCADQAGTVVVTDWTSLPGTVRRGQYIQPRGLTSGSYSTATTLGLTINGFAETVSMRTAVQAPADFFVVNDTYFVDSANVPAGTSKIRFKGLFQFTGAFSPWDMLFSQEAGGIDCYIVAANGDVRLSAKDSSGATRLPLAVSFNAGPANVWHSYDVEVDHGAGTATIVVDGGAPNIRTFSGSNGFFFGNREVSFLANTAGNYRVPNGTRIGELEVYFNGVLRKRIAGSAAAVIAAHGPTGDNWLRGSNPTSGVSAPAAFQPSDWDFSANGVSGQGVVTIGALPANTTHVDCVVNGGTPVQIATAVGSVTISSALNAALACPDNTKPAVALIARNGAGSSAASATKTDLIYVAAPVTAIAADGWQATYPSPPTLDPAGSPQRIKVRRPGFTTAGIPTTYDDLLIATQRVRQAYPNHPSLTADRVALHDAVHAGDAVIVPTGVTNGSALTYQKPVAHWGMRHRHDVGDTVEAIVFAAHYWARDGEEVACVEISVTDGTTTVIQKVSVSEVLSASMPHPVVCYRAVVDISSLANPATITVNAKVYPWVGDATAVLDSASLSAAREFSPRTFRRDTARFANPPRVFVNATTGNDSTGVVSTNAATAEASPCLTIQGALARLVAVNGSIDGAFVHCMDGTHGLGTSAATTRAQSVSECTITRAPSSSRSAVVVQWGSGSSRMRFGTAGGWLRITDVVLDRTGGTGTSIQGESASQLLITFDFLDYRSNAIAWTIFSNSDGEWYRVNFVDASNSTTFAASSRQHRIFLGCDWSAHVGEIEGWRLFGCRIKGSGVTFGRGTRTNSGGMRGFNSVYGASGTLHDIGGDENVTGWALLQGLIEFTSATPAPILRLSGDSGTGSLTHIIVRQQTIAGYFTNGRGNLFYEDTPGTSRVHTFIAVTGNILPQYNIKGDVFTSLAARIGNWWPLYGVGHRSNLILMRDTSGNPAGPTDWAQRYPGPKSVVGASSTVAIDPLWTDPRHTTSGPTAGAGNGIYSIGAGSPAKQLVDVPTTRFDFAGAARPANLQSAGAYQ